MRSAHEGKQVKWYAFTWAETISNSPDRSSI